MIAVIKKRSFTIKNSYNFFAFLSYLLFITNSTGHPSILPFFYMTVKRLCFFVRRLLTHLIAFEISNLTEIHFKV